MPYKDIAKRNAKAREYRLEHIREARRHLREYMREWRQKNPEKYTEQYRRSNQKKQDKHYHQERRASLKAEMIAAYGGQCECCGEREHEFLTLEHKRGDGKEHKKRVGRAGVYLDLKRRGWPKEDYTVLCMNCNFAKRDGRQCPHEAEVRRILRLA